MQNPVATKLEKANMMVLSKEMTDKDRSMKTQLLIRSSSDGDDKLSGEKVWKNNGFFKDIKPELNLEKVNMPENALYYINQSFLSTVKSGDIAMYNQNFILGQLIVAANQPKDIATYECNENEVKLLCCIYDLDTGEFKGIREQLAYIVLRGDKNEIFFRMALKKVNLKFCIHIQNNKFLMRSYRQHSKNIIMKL